MHWSWKNSKIDFQESIQCDDASPEVRRGCDFLWLINFFLKREIDIEKYETKMEVMLSFFFSDFVSDIYFGNKNKDFWYQKGTKIPFQRLWIKWMMTKKRLESSSPKVSLKEERDFQKYGFQRTFFFSFVGLSIKKDLEVYHLSWYLFNLRISLFWLW